MEAKKSISSLWFSIFLVPERFMNTKNVNNSKEKLKKIKKENSAAFPANLTFFIKFAKFFGTAILNIYGQFFL